MSHPLLAFAFKSTFRFRILTNQRTSRPHHCHLTFLFWVDFLFVPGENECCGLYSPSRWVGPLGHWSCYCWNWISKWPASVFAIILVYTSWLRTNLIINTHFTLLVLILVWQPTPAPVTTFTQFGDSPGDCRDSNGNYYNSFQLSNIDSLDSCKSSCVTCEGQYASLDLKGLAFDEEKFSCSCYFDDGADVQEYDTCNFFYYTLHADAGTGEIANIQYNEWFPQKYCYYTTGTPPTEIESVSHLLLCLPLY